VLEGYIENTVNVKLDNATALNLGLSSTSSTSTASSSTSSASSSTSSASSVAHHYHGPVTIINR